MSNILHLYQFYVRSHVHLSPVGISFPICTEFSKVSLHTHIVHPGTKVIHYVPSAIFTAAHDDSGVSQDEISSCLRRPCPFISVFSKVISRFYIWRRGVFFEDEFSAPWESGGRVSYWVGCTIWKGYRKGWGGGVWGGSGNL